MGTLQLVAFVWAQALLPTTWVNTFDRVYPQTLKCEVNPAPPYLNFGFRFQSGYFFSLPANQLQGAGHRLAIVTKVTPENGQPVFLGQGFDLPVIPKTNQSIETGGGYLLGEGRYKVEWLLYDEQGRACRRSWTTKVALNRADRKIKLAIPPNTVAEFSLRGAPPQPKQTKPGGPLTVFLNAAPISLRRTRLRPSDEMLLVGALSSLLERLGPRPVKLVVFNLDKRQELYRRENFRLAELGQVGRAISELELGLVDYQVLQKPKGHVEFLADLLNQEANTDTVVLLGPTTRYFEKMPAVKLEKGSARLFNLQLLPFLRAGVPFPDIIDSAVRRRKGKSLLLRTPADFARAIEAI
jgi:hypothetical protein